MVAPAANIAAAVIIWTCGTAVAPAATTDAAGVVHMLALEFGANENHTIVDPKYN